MLHTMNQPYEWASISRLEQFSLSTLVVTVSLLMLFQYRTVKTSSSDSTMSVVVDGVYWTLCAAVFLLNVAFVMMLTWWIAWAFKMKFTLKFNTVNKVLKALGRPQIRSDRLDAIVKVTVLPFAFFLHFGAY